MLAELLAALEERLAEPAAATVEALRASDALLGSHLSWEGGAGVGDGIGEDGALRVRLPSGETVALSAGEVHLA